MVDILPFENVHSDDRERVGGKGFTLAKLFQAGFPVPPGFCLQDAICRRILDSDTSDLHNQLFHEARKLGARIAIRSSAIGEDAAEASFAGQHESFLNISVDSDSISAIHQCWTSSQTEGSSCYRRHMGQEHSDQLMAVVIQAMVPAEVAGVLFTRDPLNGADRIVVEASWGLGMSVASGEVNPDRFVLSRSGELLDRVISHKASMHTAEGLVEVALSRRDQPCLDEGQLCSLRDLAERVEAHLESPQDLEWAFADGKLWLLQARPITVQPSQLRELVRSEIITSLRREAAREPTIWSLQNLAETLPQPTPMTWALVQRMMSGQGGLGWMYRDLGCHPDPSLGGSAVYDLIGGRPFRNLSRELRMQSNQLPFRYDLERLKASPDQVVEAEPILDARQLTLSFWLSFPLQLGRLLRASWRTRSWRNRIAPHLQEKFPQWENRVARELSTPWEQRTHAELLECIECWSTWTLIECARESLKPAALVSLVLTEIRHLLKSKRPGELAALLRRSSLTLTAEIDVSAGLQALAVDCISEADFVKRFGHRAWHEMELAEPRWHEDMPSLRRWLSIASPDELHFLPRPDRHAASEEVSPIGSIPHALDEKLLELSQLLTLRETAKHYFLKAYAVLRFALRELDRRYNLHGGLFYLLPEELPQLIQGSDLSCLIRQRRQRYAAALSLDVPQLIFSDDLEVIGRPSRTILGETVQGTALSPGVATAPAFVALDPREFLAPPNPFVLVAPSTDAYWTPLLSGARALVLERGGILSHGAVVAREFGLPAVSGIPGVLRRIRSGQLLRVDGDRGTVTLLESVSDPQGG